MNLKKPSNILGFWTLICLIIFCVWTFVGWNSEIEKLAIFLAATICAVGWQLSNSIGLKE